MQFAFDVYSHKVDSVTEKFNSKGHKNPEYTFENGYTCYYEDTTQLNGTEIVVETKKFHRSLYTDAVRSQLLYMEGVKYKIKAESGYEQEITTKADIIYEDDDIILSNNNQYSKPHIVINNVCYGPIIFEELEVENRNGNIGIKMQAENIDISPSRENVIWADRTRAEVLAKFEKVQDIASKEVEKQLGEKDFGQWLIKCSNVLSYGNSSNDVLGRLSRVIDKGGLKPAYSLNRDIKYKTPKELLYGVSLRWVTNEVNYRNGKATSSIVRADLDSWARMSNGLYYTTSQANNTKDKYLCSLKLNFVLLTLPQMVDETAFKDARKGELHLSGDNKGKPVNLDILWLDYQAMFKKQRDIIDLLIGSNLATNYDELVVPEDYLKKLEASEKEVDGEDGPKSVELTPAEKRKLEEKIVCYYPKWTGYAMNKSKSDGTTYNTFFEWVKHEPRIKEVNDWENVVYCFSDEDEKLLTTAWMIMQQVTPADKTPPWFMNANGNTTSDIKLVRIARGLAKKFSQFTHVNEFYKNIVEETVWKGDGEIKEEVDIKEIHMHNMFVKWYTGKKIAEGLDTVKFLTNFSAFNQDIFDKYNSLRDYEKVNYTDLAGKYYPQSALGCSKTMFDDITGFADKVLELQLLVATDASADDIKQTSTQLFSEELTGANAVDLDVYKKLQEVIEYATPLKNILSYVSPLLDIKHSVPYELESEIKDIMRNKGYDS